MSEEEIKSKKEFEKKLQVFEKIDAWSKSKVINVSKEELTKRYDENYEKITKGHPDKPVAFRVERACNLVNIYFKKLKEIKGAVFEGDLIGGGNKIDGVGKQRAKIRGIVGQIGKEKAVREGYMNEKGQLMEVRETWNNGKKNRGFGKPLPLHSWSRNLFFLLPVGDSGEKRFGILGFNGSLAVNTLQGVEVMKKVKFAASNRSKKDSNEYTLYATSMTKFETLGEVSENLRDDLKENAGQRCLELDEVEQYYYEHKKQFDKTIIVEADIMSLNLEPNASGNRIISITSPALEATDEDEEDKKESITCIVPSHIKLNFGEGSKVIIVGSPFGIANDSDDDSEKKETIMIGVVGIYAIPEFLVEPEEEPVDLDEESALSGDLEEEIGDGDTTEEEFLQSDELDTLDKDSTGSDLEDENVELL